MASSAALGVYVVTFNCGRAHVDPNALAKGLFLPYIQRNTPLPDVVVFSLEEIAPMSYSFLHSFLGLDYLSSYYDKFVAAVNRATDSADQYFTLAIRNVGMTAIIVLAKPDFAAGVRLIETAGVGVGAVEMGNKGATGVRLHHTSTRLTFVAAHLAPMEDGVQRRNFDWENIVRGLVFEQSTNSAASKRDWNSANAETEPLLAHDDRDLPPSGMFIGKSPVFFAGDLNYRSSDTPPSAEGYKFFPQPAENAADKLHYSHLLQHDQLRREMAAGRTCHLLTELPIDFPPTYKYSPLAQKLSTGNVTAKSESAGRWEWSRHRFPSWCDRILFSDFLPATGTFHPLRYDALPIQPTSDHRPVAFAFELDYRSAGLSRDGQSPTLAAPFPINPNWRRDRAAARRYEIAVGLFAYLACTWEGNGLLLATAAGAAGVWFVAAAFTVR